MKIRANFNCDACEGYGTTIAIQEAEKCTSCNGTGKGAPFIVECDSIEDVAGKFPNASSFTYL
jgi:RecJ-like exonuclease